MNNICIARGSSDLQLYAICATIDDLRAGHLHQDLGDGHDVGLNFASETQSEGMTHDVSV